MGILEETWVSQASGIQRCGRAGRVARGVCFRLFSRGLHDGLAKQTTPEIKRVPLEDLILQIELLELGTPRDFLARAVTPPKDAAIAAALNNLLELSAVEQVEGGGMSGYRLQLTPLGFHLALLPIDVRLGKMLIFASLFECLDPVLTIAATMSNKSPFSAPFGKQQQADAAKRRFSRGSMSDHFAWVNAYDEWVAAEQQQQGWDFVRSNYLSGTTLLQIRGLREQLRRQLQQAGFVAADPASCNRNSDNVHLIRCVLCAGLYPNVARTYKVATGHKKRPTGTRVEVRTLTEIVACHPSSINNARAADGSSKDRWLVYLEKVATTRVFLRDSTVVSAFALLLFGGKIAVDHDKSIVSVDGWICFRTTAGLGVLCKLVREELNDILLNMVESPGDPALAAQLEQMNTGLAQLLEATKFEESLGATACAK